MSKLLKFPISEAKNDDLHRRMLALSLREADLTETYFKTVKSGGKAGLIGVMLFHPASQIRVRCARERSRGINRFLVRRMLVEQLEKKAHRTDTALLPETKTATPTPPQILLLPKPPTHWGLGSADLPSKNEEPPNKDRSEL